MAETHSSTARQAPSRDQLVDRLCDLAAAQASIDRGQVNASSRLREDLNFDSLDTMEFAMEIEDEYGVSVSDGDVEEIKTVGQAIDLLAGLLAK